MKAQFMYKYKYYIIFIACPDVAWSTRTKNSIFAVGQINAKVKGEK